MKNQKVLFTIMLAIFLLIGIGAGSLITYQHFADKIDNKDEQIELTENMSSKDVSDMQFLVYPDKSKFNNGIDTNTIQLKLKVDNVNDIKSVYLFDTATGNYIKTTTSEKDIKIALQNLSNGVYGWSIVFIPVHQDRKKNIVSMDFYDSKLERMEQDICSDGLVYKYKNENHSYLNPFKNDNFKHYIKSNKYKNELDTKLKEDKVLEGFAKLKSEILNTP